jgi:hypothetical protein
MHYRNDLLPCTIDDWHQQYRYNAQLVGGVLLTFTTTPECRYGMHKLCKKMYANQDEAYTPVICDCDCHEPPSNDWENKLQQTMSPE